MDISAAQSCFNECKPPALRRGDIKAVGKFYRNLRKRHVRRRYSDDENGKYGHRLHKDFWKDLKKENGDPSVNCCDCTKTEACSVHLQAGFGNSMPRHVAVLDISQINEAFPEANLVASYQEVTEQGSHPGNPCHFELLPSEGGKKAMLLLENELDKDFPTGLTAPTTPENHALAIQAKELFESMVLIRLDVV